MSPPQLTVYAKSHCPLCDEALDELEGLRKMFVFDLEVIDIRDDPSLYEKYRHAIPVVCVNGEAIGNFRVDRPKLIAELNRCGASCVEREK